MELCSINNLFIYQLYHVYVLITFHNYNILTETSAPPRTTALTPPPSPRESYHNYDEGINIKMVLLLFSEK